MSVLIDTHLHMGGCISPQVVWDMILKQSKHYLAESYSDVVSQMTFDIHEPYGFHRFLDKFRILDEVSWDEDAIDHSIKHICEYLEFNKIAYAWLDFSINKYMKIGWHKTEAIKFIYDSFQKYRPNQVGLILSIKYESMKASQKQYAKLIENAEVAECLIGLDLVGDEAYFDAEFYKPIFEDWQKSGKITRAHVGESLSVENVLSTILKLKANRIAHGFKIVTNYDYIKIAKDNNVAFDLAITSNYVTGVIEEGQPHPIKSMMDNNLLVTLGSDDPIQCETHLAKEFVKAANYGVTSSQCELLKQTALAHTINMLKAQNRPIPTSLQT